LASSFRQYASGFLGAAILLGGEPGEIGRARTSSGSKRDGAIERRPLASAVMTPLAAPASASPRSASRSADDPSSRSTFAGARTASS